MCEMPTVYGCDHPKARKEHTCYECRGKISIGETYHKHHGIWDGEADTFKVCNDCEVLRAVCDKDEPDPEFRTAFGQLCESVFESGGADLIRSYLGIKRKRGAAIQPWMLKRESYLEQSATNLKEIPND